MNTLHTKGEWFIAENHIDHEYKNQFSILAHNTHTICSIVRHNYKEVGRNKFKNENTLHEDSEARANAQLIAHAPELLKMVYDLKKCIQRLSGDDISQEDKDKESQWIGEAHELLLKINPNYYYNANAQPIIIEEENIDNWDRWKSMKLTEGASIEVSERIYYEMLGAVPPRIRDGNYFEVGEAHHHTNEGKAIHQAFWIHKGRYYSGYPKS